MTYLLAKFALVYLLTAAAGIFLGWWLARRNFEDVSERYYELQYNREADQLRWNTLWERLDALPESPSLDTVERRLSKIDSDIDRMSKRPAPKDVNLEPVHSGLVDVQKDVAQIAQLRSATENTWANIASGIQNLDNRVVHLADTQTASAVAANSRLTRVETELQALGTRLRERPTMPAKKVRKTRKEPLILKKASYGKKDDLKKISGVGPKLERLLNRNGIFYFWQVADWTKNDIRIMDARLDAFSGRIERDAWVRQSKQLKKSDGAARPPRR